MCAQRLKRENIMLCYPAEERRVARCAVDGVVIAQPKLNGERCRVEWFAGEPVLVSSYGNVFKGLDHITAAIAEASELTGMNYPYDGELYVHGWSREQIHSVVSRKENAHPLAGQMEFHIFDVQLFGIPQVKRLLMLDHLDADIPTGPLKRVPSYRCPVKRTMEQWGWVEYCREFINRGFEGIILRNPFAYYEMKRTVNCLKYKPTELDEYEIVSVVEAISIEGEPKGMVGAFQVRGDDGTLFEVGAGKIKHKERIELWQKRQKLTGMLLVVKHEAITTVGGVPVACVAVNVKEKN